MRIRISTLTFLLPFLFSAFSLFAQPVNDDCSGLIDLGVAPICTDDVYDNVDATASDIGNDNIPLCFMGGSDVQNDVWFSFTTDATLIDVTITVQGVDIGPHDPIMNPQIAIYRGDCSFNGLSDLGICGSAEASSSVVGIDVVGLTPNTTYFIRINDFSATATPNWGDFQVCIEEYIPAINIGDSPSSTSCSGTLYDSGGPDADYGNNENATFVIQPAEFFGCLELEILNFALEDGNDFLNIYAGTNTGGELIASFTDFSLPGGAFTVQADGPVTVEFISDFSVAEEGFELTWQCSGLACNGSSIDNPTVISGLPFSQGGFSTCGAAATFSQSPCGPLPFMNGPELVFAYTTDGGFCADVSITGAEAGTGVLVLDGPPEDPDTECVGQGENGTATGVDFNSPGTYYIVVANSQGCTDFAISIEQAECVLNPSLSAALCNPLNGCIEPDNLPSIFNFNQGFQDIAYNQGVNSGCWLGVGAAQPNFYWFTIEAQAAGPFGFTVEAALPAEASDIDFNVWGPFSNVDVCETPTDVIDFIENNQPIRSSWAGGADPTGLASIHPVTGIDVTDEFDCGGLGTPGAGGDDFVSVIDCQPGEVYVVLINDWGNGIQSGAIQVDWAASADSVLAPIPSVISLPDTALCEGESLQLLVESSVDNITWIEGGETLSCLDCLDPVATPLETTQYVAVVDAVCYQDTVDIMVEVFDISAGPDVTVCLNEEIQIFAGSDFSNAGYSWDVPAGVSFSCTDCPNPVIVAETPGTFILSVELDGPNCILQDEMILTVLPQDAAEYNIAENQQICVGESVNVGGASIGNNIYAWTSNPPGFISSDPNPIVTPGQTTTYYLSVLNGLCPLPSIDSVQVEVFMPPVLEVAGDTAICQEDVIQLGNMAVENDVEYTWSGPPSIEDINDPNTIAAPQQGGTYTLTAVRGACTEEVSLEVEITPIAIEILSEDSLFICRGEQVDLMNIITPADSLASWSSTQPGFENVSANSLTVAPESIATYYAEIVLEGGCTRVDSVVISVDSLPASLEIMPIDTTVCQGEIVVLNSQTFEPSDFPNIEFEWVFSPDYQTGDSLYNMVIVAPADTTTYERISTSGVCTDTTLVTVNVDPVPLISLMPMDTTICPGESVQIVVEVSKGEEEIEWTSGAESLSCDDCLTPLATPPSSTTYTIQVGENCPAEASVQINVTVPPIYELTTQNFLCEGESLALNLVEDPTASYLWTSDDPDFGIVTEPSPVVTPDQTTTYFLEISNSECDTLLDEITIEVVQAPEVSAIASAGVICLGEQLTLMAEITGGTPDDLIVWVNNEGEEVGEGMEITIEPNGSDTYTLQYISGAGCGIFTDEVSVDVLPVPVTDVIPDTIICFGESIQLNLDSDDNSTYTWTSTDPAFNQFNVAEPVVSPAQTATYTLVADNGICPLDPQEVTVEVIGVVTLSLQGPNGLVCSGDEVQLTANAIGGSSEDQFNWTGSDGTTYQGDTILVAPEATTQYTLDYTSGGGCQMLTDSLLVQVEEGVTINELIFEPDTVTYFIGNTVTITADYETNLTEGLTFSWFQNGELIQSGEGLEQITVDLLQADTVPFTLIIETPSGCTAELTSSILVERPIVDVPNVFTPNDDGDNDFFNIVVQGDGLGAVEIMDFQIFNRWGQQVYNNETPDTGWDGRMNNNEQPTEAYFYQISVAYLNGETLNFQGSVTLVR